MSEYNELAEMTGDTMNKKQKDKVIGALMGLAVGDCLGVTLEFTKPLDPYMPTVTDIVGGGPFKLPVGAYTDDTSMALCIADQLIADQAFDALGQMERYVQWEENGLFSSIGRCFDIGGTVSGALKEFEITGNPHSGSTNPLTAGNGSLMRLAPVPMAAKNLKQAQKWAISMSKTTHAAPQCTQACAYFSSILYMAMTGCTKHEIFEYMPAYVTNAEVRAVVEGSYKQPEALDWVRGNGYVVNALEAALWAFWNSTSFEEGAILAVNLGEDTDTTGAIYGQLAGAFYGYDAIPENWKEKIIDRELIDYMADQLFEMSGHGE